MNFFSKEKATEPLIDIVILIHDQAKWADLCVRSIEAFTKNPFRVILVDSASVEKETHAFFDAAEKRGHTVLHLAENKSFSNGVNVGVNAGSAKYVVILNDDCVVTEGWDAALIQEAAVKRTGLVGARSNYASGAQGDPSFIGDPPWLVFVCVCLRREVWNLLGPLDEKTFDGFSTEDIDYSWHVKKSGLDLKVASGAFVFHAGSRTLASTLGGDVETLNRNNAKYNARLLDKWGKDWIETNSKLQQRGLVATFHAEEWTRVEFMGTLMGLKRSDGVGFNYYHHRRSPIHAARQIVADYATDQGFDWLVQLDDDAVFPTDLLRRLLSHQKEIVCALAYQRLEPHGTCAFEFVDAADPVSKGSRSLEGIENTGLRRVDASGFHCSIMRTSVIKKMRAFRSEKYPNGIRQYYGGFDNRTGEDFAFCVNAAQVGTPIHVDTGLISGHIGNSIVVDEAYKKAYVASLKK